MARSLSSVGNGQLANITLLAADRLLVDPKAMVLSVFLAARLTHVRSARLKGISSRSMAKKYWRKNSPSVTKRSRNRPMTGKLRRTASSVCNTSKMNITTTAAATRPTKKTKRDHHKLERGPVRARNEPFH